MFYYYTISASRRYIYWEMDQKYLAGYCRIIFPALQNVFVYIIYLIVDITPVIVNVIFYNATLKIFVADLTVVIFFSPGSPTVVSVVVCAAEFEHLGEISWHRCVFLTM